MPAMQSELPRAAMHKSALRSVQREEPKDIVRLVELMEQDYQFRLGYLVICALVQSAEVTIELHAAGADADRARRLQENLKETWRTVLPHALRAIAYGRAAFERTYAYDSAHGVYVVAGLDYLPPEHTELALDTDGSFAGVKLRAGEKVILLEPARSWWLAIDPTTLEPHGRSRYAGAPREVWKARRELEEQERIWYSKFAVGHGIARAPEKSEAPASFAPSGGEVFDEQGNVADPMEVMRRELSSIESGGILILSSRCYPDGRPLYDYQESPGLRDSQPLEHRRQMLDVAALRALGIPERAITQDDHTGSRAMAQVHLEVLYRTCEGILEQIATSFERYVVRKAVEVNWGRGAGPEYRVRFERKNSVEA